MDTKTVRLSKGRRVRNPQTGLYLIEGESYRVRSSQYWLKKIHDGDVECIRGEKESLKESKNEVMGAEKVTKKKSKKKAKKGE